MNSDPSNVAPVNNGNAEESKLPPRSIAIQIVYLILGIISALIVIRTILLALGANAANGFVNFIYKLSEPLVRPFLSMFSTEINYKVGRFEYESIVAIIVYCVIAAILVAIIRLGRRTRM